MKRRTENGRTRKTLTRTPARAARTGQHRIELRTKGILAAEPPVDKDPANLDATFRSKLKDVLAALVAEGIDFALVEGFRTVDRQQWLYGQGRPTAVPYGRPGRIVTKKDGVSAKSNHQGLGKPGTGLAADCYPLKGGKIEVPIPPASDQRWRRYADLATAHGLRAGLDFPSLVDAPHCELSKKS